MFRSLREAKMSPLGISEVVVSRVEMNDNTGSQEKEEVDYAEHDFDLIVSAWHPDKPNKAQTTLTLRCLRLDRDKVYEITTEVNGVPDTDIQVSRWALLYDQLDKLFPKQSKPIEGWM
jgi:uridylate kinase